MVFAAQFSVFFPSGRVLLIKKSKWKKAAIKSLKRRTTFFVISENEIHGTEFIWTRADNEKEDRRVDTLRIGKGNKRDREGVEYVFLQTKEKNDNARQPICYRSKLAASSVEYIPWRIYTARPI